MLAHPCCDQPRSCSGANQRARDNVVLAVDVACGLFHSGDRVSPASPAPPTCARLLVRSHMTKSARTTTPSGRLLLHGPRSLSSSAIRSRELAAARDAGRVGGRPTVMARTSSPQRAPSSRPTRRTPRRHPLSEFHSRLSGALCGSRSTLSPRPFVKPGFSVAPV